MTLQRIARTRDKQRHGLASRSVYGLNVFEPETVEAAADPRLAFLRSVAVRHPTSAHVGLCWGYFDEEELAEYLQETAPEVERVCTSVTLYQSGFGRTAGVGGCFFPSVPLSLLDTRGDDVLRDAQLALYVGADDRVLAGMRELLRDPPIGRLPEAAPAEERRREAENRHAKWLQIVADLYSLVIVTGHDGQNFEVYARDRREFDLLDPAVADGVHVIESSEWYRTHRDRLEWRWPDGCLTLKE